jgi:hypothetical protein
MRKGKLCFILLFLVLFYWPNPVLSHTYLYPVDKIGIKNLVLETDPPSPIRNAPRDEADVYFPDVDAAEDAFPVVAVLQGAFVDKQFYSKFGRQLALITGTNRDWHRVSMVDACPRSPGLPLSCINKMARIM